MGQLVFQATLGGQVNLVGPNTASTYNINVPAVAGTMVTTGDTGTVSSTMLASSLSLTTPNIGVATGTSLKVSAGFYSTSSSSFTYTDGIVMDYTTGLGRISVGTSDGLAFYNAGVATTELMRIDSTGNVGIGTGSPSDKLSLYAASGNIFQRIQSASSTYLCGTYSDGTGVSGTLGANPYIFLTSNTERMRIDSSGNVNIGTTGGSGKFTIDYTAPATFTNAASDFVSMWRASGTNALGVAANTTGTTVRLVVNNSYQLAFNNGSSEAMRIDSSGNLLVGLASGTFSKFICNTNSASQRSVHAGNASTSATTDGLFYSYCETASSTAFNHIGCQSGVSGVVFKVLGNGNAQNANNSYGAISDIKLKENVVDATPKLDKLNQVRVVNYNLIGQEQKQIGVIAQELEQIFPGMVEETPDRDAEGNDLGTTTKSVKYSVFVPMLIKAIQEQQALITQLQADVAALKG